MVAAAAEVEGVPEVFVVVDDPEEGDADLSGAASLGVRVFARFILSALLQCAGRAESRTCHVLTPSHDLVGAGMWSYVKQAGESEVVSARDLLLL